MADFIEFIERDVEFGIGRSRVDGKVELTLAIRSGDRIDAASMHPDLEAVAAAVDARLAELPPSAPGEGFQGLEIEFWDHEERLEQTLTVTTRGQLLAWLEDGSMPSPQDLATLVDFHGDIVLSVRDGRGNEMLDRRAEASARIAALEARSS